MNSFSIKRLLTPPQRSFFLFGPRSVGKSFWLKKHFRQALYIDLLENRTYLELSRNPSLLEAKINTQARGSWIVIDEIQKIPPLLEEVHRLMEKKNYRFALSGSSARKLKRGGADLLAGRAVTRHLEGFSSFELGKYFKLNQALEWGLLPLVCEDPEEAADILSAYVHTYLKEEIKEEGILRKVEPFIRFLEVAALCNGQPLNRENIAREAQVPRSTVDTYFSILEDTLLGHYLPAFRPAAKVREQVRPKFYWFDHGVARGAAGLLYDPVDSVWQGQALETLLFHELRVYNQTQNKNRSLFFYRTGSGLEIDFVIELQKRTSTRPCHIICLEVKNAKQWQRKWEGPMRELAASSKVVTKGMYGVYCGDQAYHFDGIDVLPVMDFLKKLYRGEVF